MGLSGLCSRVFVAAMVLTCFAAVSVAEVHNNDESHGNGNGNGNGMNERCGTKLRRCAAAGEKDGFFCSKSRSICCKAFASLEESLAFGKIDPVQLCQCIRSTVNDHLDSRHRHDVAGVLEVMALCAPSLRLPLAACSDIVQGTPTTRFVADT